MLKGAELKVGGARSAQYGLIRIESAVVEPEAWHETSVNGQPHTNEPVIITLLSDAILSDGCGQPTVELSEVLSKQANSTFSRTEVVGGFNRKWGLPLNQSVAVKAGSVFVFEPGSFTSDELDNLSANGIGERQVEGFGRLAVNWQTKAQLTQEKLTGTWSLSEQRASTIQLSEESEKLAELITTRKLRKILDQKLAEAIVRLEIRQPPQNAQLARLRAVSLRAQREKNLDRIKKHLQHLKSAKEQLERARVVDLSLNGESGKGQGTRLSIWLEGGLDKELIWQKYLAPASEDIPVVGEIRAKITSEIQTEYVSRLLDALFRKTARSNGNDGRQN